MSLKVLIVFILLNLTFCYYSLKLNKTYFQVLPNSSIENKEAIEDHLENLEEYVDLPLTNSDLSLINKSYILTKNINFEFYTASFYFGSNRQHFKLLLSTDDEFTTVSSINCSQCNTTNKYNPILSNTNIKLNNSFNNELYQDSISIPAVSIINQTTQKININISKLVFKVLESDSSGFLNSDLIDGILGLNYTNNSEIPSHNIIWQLYNEGYISSPSFSIIITTSNVNRFYLGDIMKNEYVNNYINSSMNMGECTIIENNWKCKLEYIEYNALKFENWESQKQSTNSTISFNTKENKLIIPLRYYHLIVLSYTTVNKKSGGKVKQFNKLCYIINNIIYCSCSDKDDFGIVTFYFKEHYKLDIDIRDYVYYDNNAYDFKCRVDISLSKNNEFVVGLRGLNNTILSFNLEEKKIKFFHKIKNDNNFFALSIVYAIIIFIISVVIKALESDQRRRH